MKQFILILVLWLSLVGRSGLVRGQGGNKYRVITPENADQVQQLAVLGRGWISALSWSSDGQTLAAASSVGVWLYIPSEPEGMPELLEAYDSPANSVAFSPDGSLLASAENRTVRLWDPYTKTQRSVMVRHTDQVLCVAISSDGLRVASGDFSGAVWIWEAVPDESQITNGIRLYVGNAASIWEATAVAFHPDGTLLATGNRDISSNDAKATVQLWDAATGTQKKVFTSDSAGISSVAFSPDGTIIAAGNDDGTVQLWNVNTSEKLTKLRGHVGAVNDIAFSPDGSILVSAGADGTLRLWNVSTGEERASWIDHAGAVSSIAFAPEGIWLASASDDGTLHLWDIGTGQQQILAKDHWRGMSSVAFSSGGTLVASGCWDGVIRVWDVATQAELFVLRGHAGTVASIAFSPDGSLLASGGQDNTVRLWDVSTGTQRTLLEGHTGDINSVVFSPDAKLLASASGSREWDIAEDDHTVRLWDVATGVQQAVFQNDLGGVFDLAFSPDGTSLAAAVGDRVVSVWNFRTDQLVASFFHTDWATAVAFSPDGTLLASGTKDLFTNGEGDDGVWLWDITQPQTPLIVLNGHKAPVNDVVFDPDGTLVASASADGTLRLWGAPTQTNVLEYRPLTTITREPFLVQIGSEYFAFSPDGTCIAAATATMCGR
jgi:WD40 repeat protein